MTTSTIFQKQLEEDSYVAVVVRSGEGIAGHRLDIEVSDEDGVAVAILEDDAAREMAMVLADAISAGSSFTEWSITLEELRRVGLYAVRDGSSRSFHVEVQGRHDLAVAVLDIDDAARLLAAMRRTLSMD